jgi:hypothetical protein
MANDQPTNNPSPDVDPGPMPETVEPATDGRETTIAVSTQTAITVTDNYRGSGMTGLTITSGWHGITTTLPSAMVDALLVALCDACPVPYVPQLPEVTVFALGVCHLPGAHGQPVCVRELGTLPCGDECPNPTGRGTPDAATDTGRGAQPVPGVLGQAVLDSRGNVWNTELRVVAERHCLGPVREVLLVDPAVAHVMEMAREVTEDRDRLQGLLNDALAEGDRLGRRTVELRGHLDEVTADRNELRSERVAARAELAEVSADLDQLGGRIERAPGGGGR